MNEECYEIMNILNIEQAKSFLPSSTDVKIVIVTGVTGQDGSLMVDYLLKNTNYVIFGGARRLSVYNHSNIEHTVNKDRFHLINFDLTDAHSISQVISQLKPDYFINLAAQSFVKSSWDFPSQTWETNTTGVLHILEAIRLHCPFCRFYNAGSSEEFGDVAYSPQDENHPLRPRSPYGASKAAARQLVKVYRESYNLYAVQGWLFNHEGVRRGEEFVTRKISKGVAVIAKELERKVKPTPLELGNLDAKRDWSDAEDMVDAIWKMLNQDMYNLKINSFLSDVNYTIDTKGKYNLLVNNVKEYVVASGECHSIREFVEIAFSMIGMKGIWRGTGLNEQFVTPPEYGYPCMELVKINSTFYRPAEVDSLHGTPEKIKKELGWSPRTKFDGLVRKMVNNDLSLNGITIK